MKQDSIISLIGIAKRAGKVVSGEFSTEKAIKERKAKLVIVAEDASDNTKKLFTNKTNYYEVPLFFYGDKDSLGHGIGCEMRTSIGILDEGFANAIIKKLGG
jgi:ribosomal protein L7Ae-like RNA K-turn-binding protein